MDLYAPMAYPKSDIQVVPDDGYNSPTNSPYYAYESAKSPASSVTSTVDSAFDELAEVIPELSGTEKYSELAPKSFSDMVPTDFSNMMHNDLYNDYLSSSPNMYEVASPHSDSDYVEALSPSGGLMQAVVEEASAKRSYSRVEPSTINLGDFWDDEPCRKRVMTDSEAVAAYATVLCAKNNAGDQKALFMPANKDSGVSMNSPTSVDHEAPMDGDFSNVVPSRSVIPGDRELIRNFLVLAEFVDTKAAKVSHQQTEPKNVSQRSVSAQIEEHKQAPVSNEDYVKTEGIAFNYNNSFDSSHASSVTVTQFVEKVLQSQGRQAPDFSQTRDASLRDFSQKNTIISEHVNKVPSQTQHQQVSHQLSVAELCKKESQKPSSVKFFNVPKEKEQIVKESEKNPIDHRLTVPINHQEVVRNWTGAPKTKKPNLVSHSSKPRLYNFLFDQLNDPNSRCMEWLNEEQGIFKFINSGEVARLWGQRKNKPNMKYENFARSLRTYVAKGILSKPRNKLVYQFMPNFH